MGTRQVGAQTGSKSQSKRARERRAHGHAHTYTRPYAQRYARIRVRAVDRRAVAAAVLLRVLKTTHLAGCLRPFKLCRVLHWPPTAEGGQKWFKSGAQLGISRRATCGKPASMAHSAAVMLRALCIDSSSGPAVGCE